MKWFKGVLNWCRSFLLFSIIYPWVRSGRNVHCQFGTSFWSPHKDIVLGNNVGIGPRCIFLADTTIGNKVLIAGHVAFLNSDEHRLDIVGRAIWDSGRGHDYRIVVEDDVWIGHGAIILSPACIGRGAVVAAGSVVTRDVARYSIVAGVPARTIRMRFSREQILDHEAILRSKGELE